jgi:DNA repair protein RecO (recombination protein O)
MTHKTKGIVLRTVKYGETSLVVTIFTEMFGVQTYMVNGVRTAKVKSAKASYFQPSAVLDLVVYHSDAKPMQRIKEFSWSFLYQNVLTDVIKNSVVAYMMELLHKCLKQPEANAELFYFCQDALLQLDQSSNKITANFPLFFALHLPYFLGFRMTDNYDAENIFLDLQEGVFINHQPVHPHFITADAAQTTSQLLKVMQLYELEEFGLNQQMRRQLLQHYHDYFALHITGFGQIKTLAVLQEVL